MTANIIVAAGSTLPNPPIGEATLFIDTENNNILSLKLSDGTVRVYSDAAAAECCSCELAKKFLHDIGCALKAGTLKGSEYQTLIQGGFNVTTTETDDGAGNKTCNVSFGPQQVLMTAVSIDDFGPVSLAGGPVQLTITPTPTGANPSVVWDSLDPTKATVHPQTGVLTPVAVGDVTIKVFSALNPTVNNTRLITIAP